jgi:hypothetical protein
VLDWNFIQHGRREIQDPTVRWKQLSGLEICMMIYLDELDLLRHTKTPLSELLEEYPEPENTEAADLNIGISAVS